MIDPRKDHTLKGWRDAQVEEGEPKEFERTYHRLVESVFSSLKARFGAVVIPLQRLQLIRSVWSQTDAGRMPLPQRTLRRATTVSPDPGSPAIGMREGTVKPQELRAAWQTASSRMAFAEMDNAASRTSL